MISHTPLFQRVFCSRILCSLILCNLVVPFPVLVNAQNPPASSLAATLACGAYSLPTAPSLTLKQQACFAGKQLISPKFALAAGVASAYGLAVNSPHVYRHTDFAEFESRVEIHYAYRAARTGAEFLVGYLHNEDPRFRKSVDHGFWRRTNSSRRNVLISPDAGGNLRPAYAPMAAALSSAFTASVLYRHSETLPNTLQHAAAVYRFYMVRSFFREFKPELTTYPRHVLHRPSSLN